VAGEEVYRGAPFRVDPENPPTVNVQTGIVDAALGRTYAEIAAEGRSQHKSQEMGSIGRWGRRHLVSSGCRRRRPAAPHASVRCSTASTSLSDSRRLGVARGSLRSELAAIESARQALAYQPLDPLRIVPLLADGLSASRRTAPLQALDAGPMPRPTPHLLLSAKERDFTDAVVRAAGVVATERCRNGDAGRVVTVSAHTFLPYPGIVTITNTTPVPRGLACWALPPTPTIRASAGASRAAHRGNAHGHGGFAGAAMTQPYFLREPRRGDIPAGRPASSGRCRSTRRPLRSRCPPRSAAPPS
jgi:hypothetical protein